MKRHAPHVLQYLRNFGRTPTARNEVYPARVLPIVEKIRKPSDPLGLAIEVPRVLAPFELHVVNAQIASRARVMLDARQSGPTDTQNMGRAAPDRGGLLGGGPKFWRAEPAYC